jgi:hypothetical protein
MEPATGQTVSQETPPTLQCKRSLLPIDEYAAREGLSRGIIEQCGKLGILQLRKYKGKTFVVDVPLSPYLCTPEAGKEPPQSTSKSGCAKKTPKPTQKAAPDVPETFETDEPTGSGAISRLVERMFETSPKITDDKTHSNRSPDEHIFKSVQLPLPEPLGIINEPAQISKAASPENPAMETVPIESRVEVIQTPELETSNHHKGPLETISDTAEAELCPAKSEGLLTELREAEEIPQLAPTPQNDKSRPPTTQAKPPAPPERSWRTMTILSSGFLLAVIFGWLWLYMDRQIQLDRLRQMRAGIQKATSTLAQANKQTETLQNELNNHRAELRRTQNELSNSKAEARKIQDELAQTRQTLKTIQQYNSEAVARLNEQIRKLTNRLTELTEAPTAPPASAQN